MTSTAPHGPLRAGRSPWWAAAACALAGFVVWQFFGNAVRGYIDTRSVFWWWGYQWFNEGSETEHGPLILGLAVWVGWRNLTKADVGRKKDDGGKVWPAEGAMFGALLLHALGFVVQQTRLSIVAWLIFGWGVMRLGGGARWGRAMVFPLGLMLLAVPVGVLDAVGFHLRLGVIATTEVLARAVGIEVVRNGTQLFSPDGSYQYDVAAACSGVRSLMALLALAALIGYLGLRSGWRRWVVVGLTWPLTFVGNVVRIGAVVGAGAVWGQRAGELVHDGAGFVVFVIVLGGVQLATRWLARREEGAVDLVPGESRRVAAEAGSESTWRVVGPVVGMALLTGWFTDRVERWEVRAEAGVPLAADGINPADLPAFLGADWIGQAAEVTAVERELLPPDTGYARRIYTAWGDPRKQVLVSIVLSGRDRASIHRPELCLVGQGWTIADRGTAVFGNETGGQLPAALLRLQRELMGRDGRLETVPALFAYWFVGRDEITESTTERLWRTAVNRLRMRPDRWAYVVVHTLVLPDETEADARRRMETVVRGVWSYVGPADRKLSPKKG